MTHLVDKETILSITFNEFIIANAFAECATNKSIPSEKDDFRNNYKHT